MEQYISKLALVAEIDRRINENKKDIQHATHKHLEEYFEGYEDALVLFKEKFFDTLEGKVVDLDKEIDLWVRNLHTAPTFEELAKFAEHFFELGLKAQKGK